MYSDELCKIILSAWIHEEHLEDAKLLPISNFVEPYDAMAKEIRSNGVDLSKLLKRFSARVVTDVLSNWSPELYQQSVKDLLREEMARTIPNNPTPKQLKEHADKFERYWHERPKATDLVENYLNALGDRGNEQRIDSGIKMLDDLTYGIHKGQLTIIGARPSVGKSAFTLQVAFNVARTKSKVLFFPLEMSAEETVDRIVMRFGEGIDQEAVRTGHLDADQMNSVNAVLDKVYEYRNYFKVYENVRELDNIRAIVQEEKPDVIVIDQLSQIRNGDDFRTIREKYVEITRSLKAMALQEDVAIWLPCQMNRESSKSDLVSIDYLKESGSIEEDADIVIILSNEKDSDGKYVTTPFGRIVKIELAKNRQGACGNGKLHYIGSRFKFESIPDGFEYCNQGNF